jgi:hypothetical protein
MLLFQHFCRRLSTSTSVIESGSGSGLHSRCSAVYELAGADVLQQHNSHKATRIFDISLRPAR